MSKTDQLRAMREARFGRKKPNPFEDAARGRDPVTKGGSHVTEPASHIVHEPLKVESGRKRRSAPAPQRPGGEMPGPTLSAPVEQRSARQSHKLEVEGSNPSRATKNTPEASGTARKAPSGSLSGGPSRNSVRASPIPVAKEPEASGHNRRDEASSPRHRGSSRLRAGRTAQDAAPSSDGGRVAIQAECPVCAARRMARAAAQKKWRKGRQAEKRSK